MSDPAEKSVVFLTDFDRNLEEGRNLVKVLNQLLNAIGIQRPSSTPSASSDASGSVFVQGINFNGGAVTIDGNLWTAYADALNSGLSAPGADSGSTSVQIEPAVNDDFSAMLNTVIYKRQRLEIRQTLPNGSYEVYLWILENYKTDWHSMDVKLGGRLVDQGIAKMPLGTWQRFGPYPTKVTNGALKLVLTIAKRDAHIMGMAIFRCGPS